VAGLEEEALHDMAGGGRALNEVLDLRKKRYGGGCVGPIPLNTEGLGSV
jgi:hypothetical protein